MTQKCGRCLQMSESWSGGCQCGAVRFRLLERPTAPHICHCRMCQKAFGNFFSAMLMIPKDKFKLTRRKISIYESSANVHRGFCSTCGTPLCVEWLKENMFAVGIATLDDYSEFAPVFQSGIESRHDFVKKLDDAPAFISGMSASGVTSFAMLLPSIEASKRQHPDHDTQDWPLPDAPGNFRNG